MQSSDRVSSMEAAETKGPFRNVAKLLLSLLRNSVSDRHIIVPFAMRSVVTTERMPKQVHTTPSS
jgi:hypothetical protein